MSSTINKPVILDTDKCNGCVSCMKRCPTEAIRVRDQKATIMYERCVGCGECVKVCPTKAKKEAFDSFSIINDYEYKVALISPSAYGQFNNLLNVNYLLNGLKNLGFDDVLEVAEGAEIVSEATRRLISENIIEKPIISSACPAILRLILMRYEHLASHLSPLKSPEEVTAEIAVNRLIKKGIDRKKAGIFLITQCAANVLEYKERAGIIDGVLSFKEVYFPLLAEMNKLSKNNLEVSELSVAGSLGVSWGSSTGEAKGINTENYLSADGIENVMTVLNELEHEKLNNLDFLELYACTSGCVGGSMNIENPFLARTRLRQLRKSLKTRAVEIPNEKDYYRGYTYEIENTFRLADNMHEAIVKMNRVKEIYASLPQLDCGACGAPCCMALAEDIVRGLNVKCVYKKDKKV